MEIKRKEGESPNALFYRFSKRVTRSGVLKEAKKRRFYGRSQNRRARRLSAIYRFRKGKELEEAKKAGRI